LDFYLSTKHMQDIPNKIMVVDDEAVNIKILQTFFRHAGFEVLTARDGHTAREVAVDQGPDLILLDIMMPGESGFETCEKLQNDFRTADIPVIFLSAMDDVQNKVRGFNVGGVDYVAKPFQKEEVLARVKTHLKLRHAFQQVITEQARRLNQVRKGQEKLLVQPDQEPKARYGVYYEPMYEAGGDFYDVFQVSSHTYAYFLGDISGHDLSASFATSALKVLVREYFSPLYTLQESMGHLNRVLCNSFFKDGRHMTAVCLLVNRAQNTVDMVSAGHPPVVYVPVGGSPRILEAEGDVLGIFDHVHVQSHQTLAQPGDRFLLYSDGLIEHGTQDANREHGLNLLLRSCREAGSDQDIQTTVHDVVQRVISQSCQAVQDDIVALGVEV